jgi:cyclopropane fatty-acyl-phospholipid synthase-like methyltransferase
MHDIARTHMGILADKATFLQRDFKSPEWTDNLGTFDVIVTMQAVHEVRHKRHMDLLFTQIQDVLKDDGILLYSDHYVTSSSKTKHPTLFLTHEEQPEVLKHTGFRDVVQILDKGEMALYKAKK